MFSNHVILADINLLYPPVKYRIDVIRKQPQTKILVLVLDKCPWPATCNQVYNVSGQNVESASSVAWKDWQWILKFAVFVLAITDRWNVPVYKYMPIR